MTSPHARASLALSEARMHDTWSERFAMLGIAIVAVVYLNPAHDRYDAGLIALAIVALVVSHRAERARRRVMEVGLEAAREAVRENNGRVVFLSDWKGEA